MLDGEGLFDESSTFEAFFESFLAMVSEQRQSGFHRLLAAWEPLQDLAVAKTGIAADDDPTALLLVLLALTQCHGSLLQGGFYYRELPGRPSLLL